jgi:hypothetical protein
MGIFSLRRIYKGYTQIKDRETEMPIEEKVKDRIKELIS